MEARACLLHLLGDAPRAPPSPLLAPGAWVELPVDSVVSNSDFPGMTVG